MEIGSLRHRITFQKLAIESDELGNQIEAWVDYKTVWAAVTHLSGREYFAAAAVRAENTVIFTIRYQPGIDATFKILFRGLKYKINAIDNIKYKDKFMEIKAVAKE